MPKTLDAFQLKQIDFIQKALHELAIPSADIEQATNEAITQGSEAPLRKLFDAQLPSIILRLG